MFAAYFPVVTRPAGLKWTCLWVIVACGDRDGAKLAKVMTQPVAPRYRRLATPAPKATWRTNCPRGAMAPAAEGSGRAYKWDLLRRLPKIDHLRDVLATRQG
jgi:hypothetical protein